MWRMVGQSGRGDIKAQWKLQPPTEIEGNVTQLQVLDGMELSQKVINNCNIPSAVHADNAFLSAYFY